MKAGIKFVIAAFAFSACAWAQDPAQNLAALHADTQKAFLARDLVRAGELAKSLLAGASQAHNAEEMGFAELMAGKVLNASGDYSRALDSLERALQLYREANETAGAATVFNEQAVAYRFTGKLSQAFDLHEQARGIFEKANDKEGLARTYFELGNTYVDADNYRSALDAFQHSLQLAEEADLPRLIANVNHGIGNVYNHQGNRELALEFYERSLRIKEQVSNYYEIINTLVNMATAYVSQGRLGDAHKGRALLTVLGADDERLTKHLTTEERSREATLKQILVDSNLQLQQAQRASVSASRLKEIQTFVEKGRLELAAFEASLYAAHPELQVHRNDTSSWWGRGFNRRLRQLRKLIGAIRTIGG